MWSQDAEAQAFKRGRKSPSCARPKHYNHKFSHRSIRPLNSRVATTTQPMILRAQRLRAPLHRYVQTRSASGQSSEAALSGQPQSFASAKQVQQHTDTARKLQEQSRAPPSDRGLYFTALGLLLVTPPAVYFWWQHRAEHMGKKKEDLLWNLEERRKSWIAEKGK